MGEKVSYLKLPSKLYKIKDIDEGWLKEKKIIDKDDIRSIKNKLQLQDITIEIFLLSIWTLLVSRYNDENNFYLNVKNSINDVSTIEFTIDDEKLFNEFLSYINDEYHNSYNLNQHEEQHFDDNYIIKFGKNQDEFTDNNKTEIRFIIDDNNIEIEIYYNSQKHDNNVIIQLCNQFNYIISQLRDNFNTSIGSIDILPYKEKSNILISLNNTVVEKDYHSLNTLLTKSFKENYDKIAIEFENNTLTYHALDELSTKEALELRKDGIGPGDIVGIVAQRSIEMIVCVMSVIKSGACFLPIDASNPLNRIKYMLNNSNAKTLYNISEINSKDIFNGIILKIPNLDATNIQECSTIPDISNPNDLLAVIYTSGSTGNPKGVMITHKNYLNISTSWGEHYDLNKYKPTILQLASFSFAVFLGEIGRAFLYGGRLVICPEKARTNHIALYEVIDKYKINMMESTPSLMIPFMEYVYNNDLPLNYMKLIAIGSELFPIDEYEKMLIRFGEKIRIVNAYGATETTIDSSFYVYDENITYRKCPPIGKPMQNTKFYILDRKQRIMPIGCIGELYTAGDGVAFGYINDPALSKEKFIRSPFNSEEKLYRTGDLGMWLPGGIMYLCGRKDDQVEIRGHRVELDEISLKALELPGIDKVVTTLNNGRNDIKYVCLYYMSKSGVSKSEIKQHLELNLPKYMLPDFYVSLDVFPLNKSGKIDKLALPTPELESDKLEQYILTEFEKKVLDIITSHVSISTIGIEKSLNMTFKELGINSISFIKIIVDLEFLLEIEFSIDDLNNNNFDNLFMFLEYVEKLSLRAIN